MSKSKLGYKRNSPYKKEKDILIDSNVITMDNVGIPLLLKPDNDLPIIAQPDSGEYYFPNSTKVKEIPMKKYKSGGKMSKKDILKKYLETLSEEDQDKFIEQFQSMTPQEQEEVYNRLSQTSMQEGGVSTSNVEVEGEETVKTPDNRLYEFKGPKHSDGGIPTYLPEGSIVFSEFLKAPPEVVKSVLGKDTKKKYSYAELSKKFPTKKYEDVLNNPDRDQFEKQGASIKLHTNNAMLETIFHAQEEDKRERRSVINRDGKEHPELQSGGYINDPKYDNEKYGVLPEVTITGDKLLNDFLGWENNPTVIAQQEENSNSHKEGQGWRYDDSNTSQDNTWVFNPMIEPNVQTDPLIIRRPEPEFVDDKPKPKTSGKGKNKQDDKPYDRNMPDYPVPEIKYPTLKERQQIGHMPLQTVGKLPEALDTSKFDPEQSAKQEDNSFWDDFGISRQLLGTLIDVGLAASNKLNIENPQYRDNRKYPLFKRFVEFDNKDIPKMYSLSIQQIQNSNLPQDVKDAKIAEINGKFQDYQSRVDFQNQQRYDDKLSQDVQTLQTYINNNIDQATQDIDIYRRKRAAVLALKDKFMAKKKADIVNPIRQYIDYVQEQNLENQLYSENYKINPVTGKVVFKGEKKDPFKQNVDLINQYAQNPNNTVPLPGGGNMVVTPFGVVIIDAEGKITQMNSK